MSLHPFFDPELPLEQRIDDLLSRMTLKEKIACYGTRPDVPRLGLSAAPHIEGYHGVAQGGPSNWGRRDPAPTTQYPQAYGLGATWDPELVRSVAAQEALEARALFQDPEHPRAGLVVRAPNADLARDPRWGRTEEVYGEDAFHAGVLATAFVRGLQGDDPRYWTTSALLKHFLANEHEDDRTRSSSDFDARLFHEYYAKPFEMAVRLGGSRALMAAYNAVNGTPAHVHPMLNEIVRERWGLDGIVCSDGGGLRLLVSDHQAFPDLASAAAACVRAGINQFLDQFEAPLTEAVERGLLAEADLDRGLRGVFRVMIRLGLLDPSERVAHASIGRTRERAPWSRAEVRAHVRRVTQKSIVLLDNSAGLLPLDRSRSHTLAVVGPRANQVLLDWYSGTPPYSVSPREGIESAAGPEVKVGWVGDASDAAVELARGRDVAIVCVGNHPEGNASWNLVTSPSEGKEAVDRKEIALDAAQADFVRRVHAANPNTVVVLVCNFPYALPGIAGRVPAIVQVTHASQELGNALADVLFGDVNPGGKLAQTWPASLEQLPPIRDYDIRHGHTYQYFRGEPQYAFGHGLSYTTFALAGLGTTAPSLALGGRVIVSLSVENTGERAGDEVVQLYVRHPGSAVARPDKALKGFLRVTLEPGETRRVEIPLEGLDLAYWDSDAGDWALESGSLELLVGTSSREQDLPLRARIQTVGTRTTSRARS
jgi:beta-glucosidase